MYAEEGDIESLVIFYSYGFPLFSSRGVGEEGGIDVFHMASWLTGSCLMRIYIAKKIITTVHSPHLTFVRS